MVDYLKAIWRFFFFNFAFSFWQQQHFHLQLFCPFSHGIAPKQDACIAMSQARLC
jgi:hypothetical protein